jgi:hypothetical protein
MTAEPANLKVIWQPSAKQKLLLSCPMFDVFLGGARGGGKTDGMLGEWVNHAQTYGEHAIGLMIRRGLPQLLETIERSKTLYGPLKANFLEQQKMWRFPNGARLRFAYLERDADADNYMGHSYTRVYVEEIGTFPDPKPILKLMATLRSGAGVPPGFRATGNPGGPGHQWVKARYIDPAPGGMKVITDPETGLKRIYIPSRVTDNAYLGADYIQRLKASGSEALVRAWLDGDWTVIEGAFFPEFSFERHVLRPFPIPLEWGRFRSMDWGSASPASVGWWAVVSDDHYVQDRLLPRGALVRYREWYIASKPGVGLKLTAAEVSDGIKDRERNDPRLSGNNVLDPSAFRVDGGPSIAEEMARRGVHFNRADNARTAKLGALSGWDQLRNRLVGTDDGDPMIFFFDSCAALIRTLPALQHDPDKPEDVDTESEDHAPDDCRYACMSRPFVRQPSLAEKRKPLFAVGPSNEVRFRDLLTTDEWESRYGRRRRQRI